MRIAFNELDSFSEFNNLSTENVVKGVSMIELEIITIILIRLWRVLFTKRYETTSQNFKDLPNNIIQAVVEAIRQEKTL